MMRTRASSISDSEQFLQNLELLKAILGDDFNEDKIKHALRGADGDVEIALNHLLNDKEKRKEADDVSDSNSLTPLEKVLCELAEEVKCPMCLGYFRNPLVLSCFHTFCGSCLESISGDEKGLQCPLCRTKCILDERGVSGLKQNHYLANIVDKLKSAQSTKMCAECNKAICTVFCKQCKGFLCSECDTKIHAMRLLQLHYRVPFEDVFLHTATTPSRNGSMSNDTDCVIPFNVKKEACLDLFYFWVKDLWFAPSDLEKNAVIQEFKAVYIPYWVFDIELQSRYSCMLSYSEKIISPVKSPENGSPVVSTGLTTPVSGTMTNKFSDIAICASEIPEATLIQNFEPWKLDQIQPFTLKYSEGVEVRAFTMDSEKTWKNIAKLKVENMNREQCERKLKTSRSNILTNLVMDTTIQSKKSRRLFVPIYITSFDYHGKTYQFIVNGSTAKVAGTRPYSTSKLASISVTGIGAAIGLISSKLYSS